MICSNLNGTASTFQTHPASWFFRQVLGSYSRTGSKLFSWPGANKINDEVSCKSCAYSNSNFTNQVHIAMWLAEFSVINNIGVEKYKDVSSALVNLCRLGVIILDGRDP